MMVINKKNNEHKLVELNFENIFNHKDFKKIKIVSYVSSSNIINNIINNFENVEMILNKVDNYNFLTNMKNNIEKYNQKNIKIIILDSPQINKFKKENIEIIFLKIKDLTIHDKFYLLYNEDDEKVTDVNVIHGSANLTLNGFGKHSKQLEQIHIDSDVKLFNIYQNRIEQIKKIIEQKYFLLNNLIK